MSMEKTCIIYETENLVSRCPNMNISSADSIIDKILSNFDCIKGMSEIVDEINILSTQNLESSLKTS